MDEKELMRFIEIGESETAELKPSLSQINEIVESVSAFANSSGGIILIGVSNSGKILGIDVGKDTVERLANKISHNIDPKLYPKISVEKIEDRKIIVIEVGESKNKPHLAFGRFFKRVGKSTLRASRDELEKMVHEKKKRYWDSDICDKAGVDDIDEEKVRWFLRKAKAERKMDVEPETPMAEALEKLGLLKYGKLTNAAVLLFGKNPQKFFLHAEARCARFKGTEAVEFIDMKIFGGNIIDQRDNVVEFIKEHIRLHAKIVGTEREETWEYPIEAIREGITNAICHRDYEISSNVQARIFDDRIEIWNPGTLAEGLTVEKLKGKHESVLKNPLIGKCFFLIKFIEQWGTGTNRIIRETLNHGLPEPFFEDTKSSFVLTFRKYKITEEVMEKLPEGERHILKFMQEKGKISRKECVELLRVSPVTAYRYFKAMEEKKIIKKVGKGKNVYYVLI